MSLDEIEAILDGSDPTSTSERLKIVRDTGMYAVALFALSQSGTDETLSPSGSGTLVSFDGIHYILTARHVWEKALKQAAQLGVTLRTGLNHRFPISIKTIIPFGPPAPTDWTEWGPDIVFLRIPEFYVGTIKAFKVFYNLTIAESSVPYSEKLKTWFLLGAPESLGTSTQHHASATLRGSEGSVTSSILHDGFDLIDIRVNVSDIDPPKSLEGVSGGGLWEIILFQLDNGKIDSTAILRGVAFWQFPVEKDHRVIRCQGIQSIRSVAKQFCSSSV